MANSTPSTGGPRVFVTAHDPRIFRVLEGLGSAIEVRPLDALGTLDPDDFDPGAAIIVAGAYEAGAVCEFCHRFADAPVLILIATDAGGALDESAVLEAGADGVLVCSDGAAGQRQLAAHLRAVLRRQQQLAQLCDELNAVRRENRRLTLATRQIDEELELAGKIQQSFLPRRLQTVAPARFAVKFSSCQAVGGDFYDVIRLDERRLGFYVADAMGHGVPAALLTIFVKKGIVTKEIYQDSYRILPPGEVLNRLNRDLIAHDVSENPFITMAYMVLDLDSLEVTCARAGHPYPLLVKPTGVVTPIEAGGIMLGIAEADYPTAAQSLAPGDRVVLYTDGIDSAQYGDHPQGTASFQACLADHDQQPIDQLVEEVYRALFPAGVQDDDFTLLVLEIEAKRA